MVWGVAQAFEHLWVFFFFQKLLKVQLHSNLKKTLQIQFVWYILNYLETYIVEWNEQNNLLKIGTRQILHNILILVI
jgi:hypothetical protein